MLVFNSTSRNFFLQIQNLNSTVLHVWKMYLWRFASSSWFHVFLYDCFFRFSPYVFIIFVLSQVIGHEITHGFDDQGRQNDKNGNAIAWWTNATLEAFRVKAQCIVDQYDNIRVPEIDEFMPNATLNGVNTQVGPTLYSFVFVCVYLHLYDRKGNEGYWRFHICSDFL